MVDIIFIIGDKYFDHPLCGAAIIRRLLEKEGYSVDIVECPKEEDIARLERPKLFFAISSGSIDSMVKNYTPLKKKREDDEHSDYGGETPDRAVTVYSNWVKRHFKDSLIVLGGVEAGLRRFVHYDYWDNNLRRPILFDTRADILVYGSGEKQILEISQRAGGDLKGIPGTCVISREIPEGFTELPSFEEVKTSKERFCDMQNLCSISVDLAQKIDNRYCLQYKSPIYTSEDLDGYYELPFSREVPKELRGFQFSVVTHRGCIGECNFCSIKMMQGTRVISRSEKSIVKEIENMARYPFFKGNVDDLTAPSANMYGMDCNRCERSCIDCQKLDRSNRRYVDLLRKARKVAGVKNVRVLSGIRFDLCSPLLLKELVEHHIYETLRIAPEHVDRNVLRLMNKDRGDLGRFISDFNKVSRDKSLSFYFMAAHPGSGMREAEMLADAVVKLRNAHYVQVFTPTPMSVSTCMYHTGLDPKTKKKVYVPYTYLEKKEQKRVCI